MINFINFEIKFLEYSYFIDEKVYKNFLNLKFLTFLDLIFIFIQEVIVENLQSLFLYGVRDLLVLEMIKNSNQLLLGNQSMRKKVLIFVTEFFT